VEFIISTVLLVAGFSIITATVPGAYSKALGNIGPYKNIAMSWLQMGISFGRIFGSFFGSYAIHAQREAVDTSIIGDWGNFAASAIMLILTIGCISKLRADIKAETSIKVETSIEEKGLLDSSVN